MQKPETWINIYFSILEEETEIYISTTAAAGEAEPVLAGAANVFSEKFRLYLKGPTYNSEDPAAWLAKHSWVFLLVGRWVFASFYFLRGTEMHFLTNKGVIAQQCQRRVKGRSTLMQRFPKERCSPHVRT